MFGCWETLYVIKQAMEAAGYQGAGQTAGKLIEATEAHDRHSPKAPSIRRATRRSTARSTRASATRTSRRWKGGKLNVVHRTSIEDGLYEPEADYTKMAL